MASTQTEKPAKAVTLYEYDIETVARILFQSTPEPVGTIITGCSQLAFNFDRQSPPEARSPGRMGTEVLLPDHTVHTVEAPESDLDALGREVEDLRIRNERLRSLVSQERRVATNVTRTNDRLLRQLDTERESRNELLNTLKEMAKANNALQSALTAEKDGHTRMFESHQGVVMHVDDDSVVVTYSVDGEYVDQTYSRDQFIGRRLPKKGDRLGICVHVAELPKDQADEVPTGERADERRRHRKRAIRPPRRF